MFNIKFTLEHPLVPEFDPEIHDPDEVFALLCYRGIHYAKWCNIKIPFNNKQGVDRPPSLCHNIFVGLTNSTRE